jgi:hypothetical protein
VKFNAGVTQLVESQPSKLLVAGPSPVSRSKKQSKSAEDQAADLEASVCVAK